MKTLRWSPALVVLLGLLLGSRAAAGVTPAPQSADLATGRQPDIRSSMVRDDPDGRAMMQAAQRIIAAYHAGQPKTTNTLRVIYFVPKDGQPLSDYADRLDRVVNDISDFYRDGLRRFGLDTTGLPLERQDGKLVLHLVRGQLPGSGYHYNSDPVPEIRDALKDTMDIDREYLLVLYALSVHKADGTYVFDAPYYGEGNSSQRAGLCHAVDCELLDPRLLTETNRMIVFDEHNYKHIKMTVAQFNSWYLGGIAHELGHALGLPHDDGGSAEKQFGTSLMGEGNLTYRQELWGGGNPRHHLGIWAGPAPTYLGRASALQLASHPLFTGSDRGRWDPLESDFQTLGFSVTNGMVRIQGTVTSNIPAYAVIAYVWPVDKEIDDHWVRPCPCVLQDGAFTLDLGKIHTDHWHDFHLKLATLHVNGATTRQEFQLHYDAASAPDAAALNEEWIVNHAEQAVMHGRTDALQFVSDSAIAAAPTPEAARKLRLLRTVLEPPAPVDLATAPGDSVFLSDAAWTDAKVGWGQVARNYFWFDKNIQNGVFIMLKGKFYDKGLYAHSSARYSFPLSGKWKTFTATIGLRDGANIQGSAIFTVRGDGRKLYRSRMLRVGDSEEVQVDVSKVQELELLTEGGEGHNHNSWAVWAAPAVHR